MVTSTPSTPSASCAKFVPKSDRLNAVAPAKSGSIGWPEPMFDLYRAAEISPNATRNTRPRPRVIQVERRDQSLVHSERRTWRPVTR